jgi:hypothetical protein
VVLWCNQCCDLQQVRPASTVYGPPACEATTAQSRPVHQRVYLSLCTYTTVLNSNPTTPPHTWAYNAYPLPHPTPPTSQLTSVPPPHPYRGHQGMRQQGHRAGGRQAGR